MAHPCHHAISSARRFGGAPSDYQSIHDWFDASKVHLAIPQHRALRHHSAGIFEAEAQFGHSITNTAGRSIPVRWIGEQHVREDCRRIPSVGDWLAKIPMEPWMANGVLLKPESLGSGDPQTLWIEAVTTGKTILGLRDWIDCHAAQGST